MLPKSIAARMWLGLFLYLNVGIATHVLLRRDCEKIAAPFTETLRYLDYRQCQSAAPFTAYVWPLYWLHRFYDRVLP